MKGISQSLIESSRQRIEQEQESANRELRLAELFDKHIAENGIEVKDPKRVHGFKLYGAAGQIHWEDATPEEAVKIMEAFPPVASGLLKGTFTSYIPETARESKEREKDTYSPGDGYTFTLNGGQSYPVQVEVEWYTLVSGELLKLEVRLLNIHDVTPRIAVQAQRNADGSIIRITDCRIVWPVSLGWALQTIRYGSGDHKTPNPFLVWAHDGGPDTPKPILETVKEWAKVCYEKRQHSRQAYQEDKASGLPAEPAAAPYERSGLKAGTKAQYDCLNTEEARKDMALANKHWTEYVADSEPDTWPSPISEYKKSFDHYTWACHWLHLHGLYVDPSADGYKYGSAWL